MEVLLLNPPYRLNKNKHPSEHHGIASLASMLRNHGIGVEILDANVERLNLRQTFDVVARKNFKLLGITALNGVAQESVDLATALKKAGIKSHICLGGYFPSLSADKIMGQYLAVDSVIRGEGEIPFLMLAKAILDGNDWSEIPGITYYDNGHVHANETNPLNSNLDALPFMARDTLRKVLNAGGPVGFVTSRGCHGRCSFCSIRAFDSISRGLVWRARSARNVIEEIEMVIRDYRIQNISFVDGNFIGPGSRGRRHAYEIADELRKRKLGITFNISCRVDAVDKDLFKSLKEAGLRKVFLGIESGVQRSLDTFNKDVAVEDNDKAVEILSTLGIEIRFGFITFDPYSSLEEIQQNIAYIEKYRDKFKSLTFIDSLINKLTIFCGSTLKDTLEKEGNLVEDHLGYEYEFNDPRMKELYNWMVVAFELSKPLEEAISEIDGINTEIYAKNDSELHKLMRYTHLGVGERLKEEQFKVLKALADHLTEHKHITETDFKTITSDLTKRIKELIDDVSLAYPKKPSNNFNNLYLFNDTTTKYCLDRRNNSIWEIDELAYELIRAKQGGLSSSIGTLIKTFGVKAVNEVINELNRMTVNREIELTPNRHLNLTP